MDSDYSKNSDEIKHKIWVRTSHWIIAISFLVLCFSGFEILKVHPRLYWGEVGNDLTPALLELPISRNYKHEGWEKSTPIFKRQNSPVSSSRTYEIYNQNGWARSLHFLFAWLLVLTGIIYLIMGIYTGHLNNHIWFSPKELSVKSFWQDFINHLRMQISPATSGLQYGILQKSAYITIIFIALPLVVITGLTMSPAITAAYPFLLEGFW